MNILLIANFIGTQSEIAARRNNIITKALIEKGYNVCILHVNSEKLELEDRVVTELSSSGRLKYFSAPLSFPTIFSSRNVNSQNKFKRLIARSVFALGIIDHYGFSLQRLNSITKIIINNNNIDIVISSSPSFICPVIAYLATNGTKIPFIVDNRDWWASGNYNKSRIHFLQWIRSLIENRVHRSAKLITCTSQKAAIWYASKFKFDNVIYFYSGAKNYIRNSESKATNITYAGSMYGGRRRLDIILDAIRISNLSKNQKINLVGPEIEIYSKFTHTHSDLNIQIHGRLPKMESDKLTWNSLFSIILHSEDSFDKQVMPGKFYEFLELKVPIICVGPPDSEIGILINKYQLGVCSLSPHEISQFINSFLNGSFAVPEFTPNELTSEYAMINFVDHLNDCVKPESSLNP